MPLWIHYFLKKWWNNLRSMYDFLQNLCWRKTIHLHDLWRGILPERNFLFSLLIQLCPMHWCRLSHLLSRILPHISANLCLRLHTSMCNMFSYQSKLVFKLYCWLLFQWCNKELWWGYSMCWRLYCLSNGLQFERWSLFKMHHSKLPILQFKQFGTMLQLQANFLPQ